MLSARLCYSADVSYVFVIVCPQKSGVLVKRPNESSWFEHGASSRLFYALLKSKFRYLQNRNYCFGISIVEKRWTLRA